MSTLVIQMHRYYYMTEQNLCFCQLSIPLVPPPLLSSQVIPNDTRGMAKALKLQQRHFALEVAQSIQVHFQSRHSWIASKKCVIFNSRRGDCRELHATILPLVKCKQWALSYFMCACFAFVTDYYGNERTYVTLANLCTDYGAILQFSATLIAVILNSNEILSTA